LSYSHRRTFIIAIREGGVLQRAAGSSMNATPYANGSSSALRP